MEQEHRLSDVQMQQFIADGYLTVQADFSNGFHEELHACIEEVFSAEANPGNNILPRLPQIQQIFDHPTVRGALTSILGPGYLMNPHRHCHLNPPGSPGQRWHKDNYVFDELIRHPRPRWVLAFYYPQDVSEEMGPSGLIPGRHYHHHISYDEADRTLEAATPICGPAGSVALIHYDSWHRAMANRSGTKRYMLKFLFERMEEPSTPAWNHGASDWPVAERDPLSDVHADVWRWLAGRGNGLTPQPAETLPHLLSALDDADEGVALAAAYALGAYGEVAVSLLIDALRRQAIPFAARIAEKLPGNPRGSNPATVPAAHALSAVGAAAVHALTDLLSDEHWCVRTLAADTLGDIGLPQAQAVPLLAHCLQDEHGRVRRHAAETLGRMGATAEPALPALIAALGDTEQTVRYNAALALAKIALPADGAVAPLANLLADEDRYVRHIAAVALRRLKTPQATDALMDALFAARWCPITTPQSMY